MKQLTNKNKIIYLISLIIIIAGIIIIATKGFNFDLNYEQSNQIEMLIGKQFNIADIKQITDEIFQKENVVIQKVEVYGDTVSIKTRNITDEQKTNLVQKINEKYGTQLEANSVQVKTIPHTRARDILKPYIAPFIIAIIITLVYMAIRFFKLGIIKTILKTLFITIFAQLILLSIMAIARIPLGEITISIMIFIYVVSILGITIKFEKDLKSIKTKEE